MNECISVVSEIHQSNLTTYSKIISKRFIFWIGRKIQIQYIEDEFRLFSIDRNEECFVKNKESDNDVFVNIIIVIINDDDQDNDVDDGEKYQN